jgi:uncharacterized protein YkwD
MSLKTRALTLFVMLACIGSGPASGTLHINQPHAPVVRTAEQIALVDDLNATRVAAGLVALTVDERLMRAAMAHARDMAANHYFAHEGIDGSTLTDRLRIVGFDWTVAAENIALNSDERHAHDALLHSPEHRENILDPRVRYVGVAALSIGASSTLYVEDFAR